MSDRPSAPIRVLILGASYGSLLATRLLMAGHHVTCVCSKSTADLINREGTTVRFPMRGREDLLPVASADLAGQLDACTPAVADPSQYDLVILGMQEAHYGERSVHGLMTRVAQSRKPCLAIMNMPPLPFLKRVPALAQADLRHCYAEPKVWDGFEPGLVSLASPDPQAFRPKDEPKNVLQVGLPTNFKAARFESDAYTALLRGLETDIERARLPGKHELELPVKVKVHDSLFVPLAKWPMLIAGNYRCIRPQDTITIRDAVHGDVARSRAIYDWVTEVCMELGAKAADLVPFDKYAKAAESLGKPSSAARALLSGALHIERVDSLVHSIATGLGKANDVLQEMVTLIDARLIENRIAATSG